MRLKDKVAIVTGAGRGIGKAIAHALSREGAKVVVSDVDSEPMKETAEEINSSKGVSIAVQADVSSKEDIKSLFEKTVEHFKRIDILVNNAAFITASKENMLDLSDEEWDRALEVNIKGTFLCCKEVLPLMMRQKYGRIINISALSGKRGGVTSGLNYCSSKGGVLALTRSLAKYAAPHNVLVNSIAPGIIQTRTLDLLTPEMVDKQRQAIPLQRIGDPEEVAKVVVFLASDDASYIVGETINVNGGLLMD